MVRRPDRLSFANIFSSVTSRAIYGWGNLSLADKFCSDLALIRRWLPIHIGDLIQRPQAHGGIAVAFQTPTHRKRFLLFYNIHLSHVAVTTWAANTSVKMGAMGEVSIVGKIMHPDPLDRHSRGPAFADRQQTFTFGQNCFMAIHANLRGRDVGHGRDFDIIVAVTAVQAEIAGVKLVAVAHWLLRPVTDVGIPGRAVIPEKASNRNDENGNANC